MAHELADGDLADIPEGVVHLTQLGHILHDRIVEAELAPVAQLHDADRRERLGDRRPVEDRAVGDDTTGRGVGQAVVRVRQHAVALEEPEGPANRSVLPECRIEGGVYAGPGAVESAGLLGPRGKGRAKGGEDERRGQESSGHAVR